MASPRAPAAQPPARFTRRGTPPLHYSGRWTGQPPVWREGRGALEYVRLVRHPTFRGVGVADGGGQPVLLLPGFMAGDSSLSTMRAWLLRTGYEVEMAGLIFNIRYSEMVVSGITRRLEDIYSRVGRPVTLVGHSRGGVLAKVVADRHPRIVERVVALGAPLADPYDVHPLTMAGVRLAHAFNLLRYARTGSVERRFLEDLEAPARVPLTSLYSRSDGIVHWRACLRADAECLEVHGSHIGLSVNVEVYEVLARLLQAAPPRPTAKTLSSARPRHL